MIRNFFLLSAFLVPWALGEPMLLSETIVDAKALTFAKGKDTRFAKRINAAAHQQDALTTFEGYQYVTYYNAARHVCIGRRELPDGSWNVIELSDHRLQSSNAHRVSSMGICHGDGTIHLAFDQHGSNLNYRVSAVGAASNPKGTLWKASLFGPITNRLGATGKHGRVTYPRFVSTPNGDLLFYYRNGGSGSGDGHLYRYDGSSSKWVKGMGKFISKAGRYQGVVTPSSDTRNPYLNGISYGGNRLHCSWCWRETPNAATNHDVNYAYSDDHGLTWCNTEGTQIAQTGETFISVNSPKVTVAEVPQRRGLSNQDAQYAYPDGSFHIITRHQAADSRQRVFHHYSRSAEGVWQTGKLDFGGSRSKLVGSPGRSLYLISNTRNAIEITKGSPDAQAKSWTWERIYRQNDSPASGDGIVDFALWELSGVLSILDQEKPRKLLDYGNRKAIDGIPSPLIVRDIRVTD